MENASKALLIAGAILIAILLIAIGMMVFNSASGVIDTAASGMSDHEKTMHNKKFTIYEGTQSASTIKEICDLVHSNNASDATVKVRITLNRVNSKGVKSECSCTYNTEKYETNYNYLVSQIKGGKIYTVECQDADGLSTTTDGIISRVYIDEK